jgi:plastocyanin
LKNARARLGIPLGVALAAVLAGSVFAGAASAGNGATIFMEREGSRLFFQPKTTTIDPGGELRIENSTNPQRFGPHTFSLVKRRVRPDTKQERRNCFNKGHICRKIARWHDTDFQTGEVGTQVVEPGILIPQWDMMGDKDEVGDSWYTETRNESHARDVGASPGATLYFMCAIHPNMKGKVVVNEL